jgi:glucose/arabinose dehydrogenase
MRHHHLKKLGFYFSLLLSCFTLPACSNEARTIAPPSKIQLNLPPGFEVNIFSKLGENLGAESQAQPRMMAFDSKGNLYVALANANQVIMLPDANKDGLAEAPIVVAKNLNSPNGIAIDANDNIYIANHNGVVTLNIMQNTIVKTKPLISNLPDGGHSLKSIKIGPDNHLYLNVGSSCNVCAEDDPLRATILRYTLDGKPAGSLVTLGKHAANPVWARGLRNSQGFIWHPKTGAMFATNNGSDNRAKLNKGVVIDEIPPEHLNKIEPGKHYGWPYCWGDANNLKVMVEDPNFLAPDVDFCHTATPPAITFTSHSTPIGITFLDKSNFPAEYKSDAIVALHGSWNRKNPSGYKLVRVKFDGDKPVQVVDFATGWLNISETGESATWGRPVDVIIGPDGALYVSDDRAGYIYRIRYQAKN